MAETRPDLVLVHGDTTTAFASSLAAFYSRRLVGHVEAGLRTGDPLLPYPEEMNRRLVGVLAGLHFAPTSQARENLLRENVAAESIIVTGNTVIDAVRMAVSPGYRFPPELNRVVASGRRIVLVTAHRRENWGAPMRAICRGLCDAARQLPDTVFVFPVHPNPRVRESVENELGRNPGFALISPLNYGDMANLMARACLVITDSGGLQEEAPALGVPVLVLREKTERPEALAAGTARLIGVSAERVFGETVRLLTDRAEYTRMTTAVNPYGDGRAAERIRQAVLYRFGLSTEAPTPFSAANGPEGLQA
jgi:UDP-N-acetylglucosamine 2-epimerase (non-hydrolysing)